MAEAQAAAPVRASDPVLAARRGHRSRIPMVTGALAVSGGIMVAAVAGCGGGGSGGSSGSSSYKTPATSSAPAGGAGAGTIKTATLGSLGTVLVDGEGRTVYLFEKDKGDKSSCSGSCAAVWPPVTTSAQPKAAAGADASKLGTTRRSDGTTQVTYGGHPLYDYAPDGTTSGSAKGQGLDQFGAKWFVMSSSGAAVQQQGSGGGY
jgi:predicted lipoprotein with Yx(FWY)xxD motif